MSVPQAEATTGSAGRIPAGAARVDRDAALVEGLRKGDPTATELLLDTYGDRVYRLAIRITGNEQDAEEVVQDALWTAARKIGMFKGESAFGSWVYRITANTAYQKLRGRQSRKHEVPWTDLRPAFDDERHHAEPVADWSGKVEEPALQAELRTVLLNMGWRSDHIMLMTDSAATASHIIAGIRWLSLKTTLAVEYIFPITSVSVTWV